ncbi:MAG: GntG family PLP-dependent aldolase, partial [Acidobacteriota bacterium]
LWLRASLRADEVELNDAFVSRVYCNALLGDGEPIDIWRQLCRFPFGRADHTALPLMLASSEQLLKEAEGRLAEWTQRAAKLDVDEPGQEALAALVLCQKHIAKDSGVLAAELALLERLEEVDAQHLVVGVEKAIHPTTGYTTPTAMLALENTHNLAGGRTTAPERTDQLVALARKHGLPVHLDGARIFNASIALGVPASRLAQGCDTVMFCLSKGLAAPVGSVLVGDEATIKEGRRIRKLFGGGMRQAGIIAAGGMVALETMVDRLGDDNRRARRLAESLDTISGIDIDPQMVDTNIVFFRLVSDGQTASAFARTLSEAGILVHALGENAVRAVTHYHITDADIDSTVTAVRKAVTP